MNINLDDLKYPIGKFDKSKGVSSDELKEYIDDLAMFPSLLRTEVANLSEAQLDTPYRDGGWTIRQVVHHCADSHMNSLMRFKLALTEDKPTIKPYDETLWAMLPDSMSMPIAPALKMLEGIHERWTFLLRNLKVSQLERVFLHPAEGQTFRLDETISMYAWHSNHHLAHITTLKQRKGW